MTNNANLRLSKTLGALLGVHAGDSLGATLEFESYARIKRRFPDGLRNIVGGGAFRWPAGHATDDTDLTRAVLLAYRDRNHAAETQSAEEFDVVVSAAEWSLKWCNGDWPDRKLGQPPADIGGATNIGLSQYQQTRDVKTCGAGPGSAGNGSLMRCIPTALFTPSREARIKESMAISAFTHNDKRCTVSCAAYNEMVAALVEGKSPEEATAIGLEVAGSLDCPDVGECIERGKKWSIEKFATDGPGDNLPSRTMGYVLQSFSIAVAALLDSRGFEDVLVDVVRLGGDTDTNGAIAGGLLGARDGVENMPKRWLEVLQFRKEFEDIATSLLQAQNSAV